MKHALTVKQSVLYTDLSVIGNKRDLFLSVLGIDYEFQDYEYLDGRLRWNYDDDLIYNRAFLRRRSLNASVTTFIEAMVRESDNLMAIAQQVSAHRPFTACSDTELARLFEQYVGAYLRTMPALFMFWNTERMLLQQLEDVDLPLLYGPEAVDSVLRAALVAPKPNFITLERESLLGLGIVVSAQADLSRLVCEGRFHEAEDELAGHLDLMNMVDDHVRRFGFTTTAFHLNPPLTRADVVKRLREIVLGDPREVMSSEILRKKDLAVGAEEQLKRFEMFPEILARLELARWLVYWKNQRIDVQFLCDFQVRSLFDELASRLGLALCELVALRYNEVLEALLSQHLVTPDIQARQQSYCYLLHDGLVSLSTEVDTLAASGEFHTHREVRGDVANPGKAKGTVKVLLTAQDMDKVEKGDILVAPMTRPEMIVALEKAAAFVTDEGGRLCHAAIVSREMNKPCITGTEFATKILRDGQLVLVDADEGVVSIIDDPAK